MTRIFQDLFYKNNKLSLLLIGGKLGYDITLDLEGNLWFGIGDVSGHGVTPRLIMMMAQTVHTAITTNYSTGPRDVVIMVNKVLYKNVHDRLGEDHFMTFMTLKYHTAKPRTPGLVGAL